MENIRSKLFAGVAVLLFIGLCVLGYLALFVNSTHYYTRIDNTAVKQLKPNEFEYNLTAYDAHGKMTNFVFKANKKLRDDAYLELDVMFIRGVVNWREVQYDDLPQDVRPRYQSPVGHHSPIYRSSSSTRLL